MPEKSLTPTMEDYLEALYLLNQEKGAIRVKNIAKKLGVKMPTVVSMLKTLDEKGFIEYEKHEFLELTKKGRKVGKEIDRRHHIIERFLTDILKIDSKLADEEACMMEHGISPDTLNRLAKFMEFVQSCPRTGSSWLKYFEEYCQYGLKSEKCIQHMKEFSSDFQDKLTDLRGMHGDPASS